MFAKDGDDTSEDSTQTWNREGPWFSRVREECLAVNRNVGVLDLPGFQDLSRGSRSFRVFIK